MIYMLFLWSILGIIFCLSALWDLDTHERPTRMGVLLLGPLVWLLFILVFLYQLYMKYCIKRDIE